MPRDDDAVRVSVDGVVHDLSSEYNFITRCGLSPTGWETQLTLDPTTCMVCLADENDTEVYFRCKCSWVGGDPVYHKGKPTCPACWVYDKKHVVVAACMP